MPCSEHSVSTTSMLEVFWKMRQSDLLRQQPQLRPERQRGGAGAAAGERALVQRGDEAVPPARAAVLQPEREVGGGADQVGGGEVVALRLHGGSHREQAVDALVDVEAVEQQHVGAEPRVRRHHAAGLRVGHVQVHRGTSGAGRTGVLPVEPGTTLDGFCVACERPGTSERTSRDGDRHRASYRRRSWAAWALPRRAG